ncbi:hypothetical protein LCGC14_0175190 [marine sediment metagenome]|uniref:Uncharacterized protein n=1 Tax=marine sediment metagenome TaxID=412755 RepID=A0A0F9UR80_9ZZZZ
MSNEDIKLLCEGCGTHDYVRLVNTLKGKEDRCLECVSLLVSPIKCQLCNKLITRLEDLCWNKDETKPQHVKCPT